MESTDNLEMSVKFLVNNASKKSKDIDKLQLKFCVTEIERNTVNGLSRRILEELAEHVVFRGGYDKTTRRKILYSLIPEGEDFPYHIIPLAVSCATVVPVDPSWQFSVLSWLGGLLEYGVIDAHNRYVHICYQAIFNLASNVNLVLLVCKILGYTTARSDVSECRTKALFRLKEKPGFYEKVSQLLRLYRMYRPDLVVGRVSYRYLAHHTPRNMKAALLSLRDRLQEGTEKELVTAGQDIWPDIQRAEKVNPYQRATVIPQPDNNYYTETIEEKTKKVIFLSQYRRFSDLVRGMSEYQHWRWPNNPATHLRSPFIIPLFRPHEDVVLVGITNWLEVALRTELVDKLSNPSNERCEKLMRAVHGLMKVTGCQIPVINHFLSQYMTVWDQNSNFDLVLLLFEGVIYSSPQFVSLTFVKLVTDLLDNASVCKWCRVVEAVSNTAGKWAMKAHEELDEKDSDQFEWPDGMNGPMDAAIVGLWYLTSRLECLFLAALIEYDSHPMIVNQILDFYEKVNMYTHFLNLPAVFLPPVPFTVAAIFQGDLVVIHRLGMLLSRLPSAVDRLKKLKASGKGQDVLVECLSMCESFNQSVRLFLKGVYVGAAFGKTFQEILDPFYSFQSLPDILSSRPGGDCASVINALPYLPFYARWFTERDRTLFESDEKKEIIHHILDELQDSGFPGIKECLNAYQKV